MTSATKEAIQFIKDAGFTHIKFELEGDIGRDGDRECSDCHGSGNEECESCGGEGAIDTGTTTRISTETIYGECEDCYGEGERTCYTCDGSGTNGSYYDEDTCEQYMRDFVRECNPEAYNALNYGRFYEDGSVDSEFTFTIPIERILEGDFHLWVKAFVSLAEDECDGEVDVQGAGMHITLLRGSDYESLTALPRTKLSNFTSQVSKLLPALFFVASAGHQSRGLNYRMPQISNSEKYSAIYTHGGRCLEYRLFECCYNRPDAIFEYIQAIANTLKFYVNPSLTIKELGKRFGFTDEHGSVARFYNTPEQLRILNATIKEIKPKDKSFKKLKEERGVIYTVKSLTLEEKRKMAEYRNDWGKYINQWHRIMTDSFDSVQQRVYDRYLMDGISPDEARRMAKGLGSLGTFEEFVDRNTRQSRSHLASLTRGGDMVLAV